MGRGAATALVYTPAEPPPRGLSSPTDTYLFTRPCLRPFCPPPPLLQVSCNDLDLVWELDSCYWLEKLATLYTVGA